MPALERELIPKPKKGILWQRTHEEVGGNGSAMPLGNSLSDDEMDLISAWIEAGAPQ